MESDDQTDEFHVGQFAFFSFLLLISSVMRNNIIMRILLKSSLNLWIAMLRAVVSAKSVFFDSNPSGRILNRFTSDTFVMDE